MKKQLTLSDLNKVKGSLEELGKKTQTESFNKDHKAWTDCTCDKVISEPVGLGPLV